MSVRTDIVNLQVNINGDKSKNELNQLRKRAADLSSEMKGLKKNTDEYKRKANELKAVRDRMAELHKQIGLTSMSQRELVNELKKLQMQKNMLTPQTKEFNELQKRIDAVNKRLKEVRTGAFGFKQAMAGIKTEVKQFGMLAAGYLGFEFITGQFRNLINVQMKYADSLADIRKVTGMTEQETKALAGALKQIDTRTSNSNLREMAVAAGKLGIAKNEILGFVEAVDKINVALGDDLTGGTEEIMKKLGKIVQVYGVDKMEGLSEGLLKVGSAINELSASSSASADYMVEFSKRMGGISPLVGMSIQEILGLGATLDQLGQTSEVSSTALSKMFVKFAKDADVYAKMAGIPVKEFREMLEKDFTGAFITVLETVGKTSNGINQLAATLGDLGMDGGRVIGVLGSLANNTEILIEQIEIANDAYEEGTSITDEFMIKNQNFAAVVDKLGKEFNKFFTSDTINKGVRKLVMLMVDFLNGLKATAEWIGNNKTVITLWSAAIVVQTGVIKKAYLAILAYASGIKGATVAQALNTLASKADIVATTALGVAKALLTLNITKLRQEFRLLTLAMGTNPLTATLVVVGALILAFKALSKETDKINIKRAETLGIEREAARQMSEIINKQNVNIALLKDETISVGSKAKALKALIDLDPQYLSGLTEANIKTGQGIKLLAKYNEQLKLKLQIEATGNRATKKREEALNYTELYEDLEYAITSGEGFDYSRISKEIYDKASKNLGISLVGSKDAEKHKKEMVKIIKDYADKSMKEFQEIGEQQAAKIEEETKMQIDRVKENIDALENQLKAQEEGTKEYREIKSKINKANKELTRLTTGVIDDDNKNYGGSSGDDDKAKKLKEKQDTIKEKIASLLREVEAMESDAERNDGRRDEREIARVKEKYAKLIQEAVKYGISAAELTDAQERELAILLAKQFKEQGNKEYKESLQNLDDYLAKEKDTVMQQYADGIINKQEFEDALETLERQGIEARINIANDYIDTAAQAETDLQKAKTDAVQKGIADREKAEAEAQKAEERRQKNKLAGLELNVLTAKPGSKNRLNAEKALLKSQMEQELENIELTENEKELIREKYRQKAAEADDNHVKAQAEKIQQVMQVLSNVANAYSSFVNMQNTKDENELNQYKARNNEKREALRKRLDDGKISQQQYDKALSQIDAEEDRRNKDFEAKRLKREKAAATFSATINTIAGVARAFADYEWPYSLIVGAIVGAAGAIEIANINAKEVPQGRRGLVVQGPSHEQKGIDMVNNQTGERIANIEGGEPVMVLSKNTYGNNKDVIDELLYNSMHRNGARIKAANWYGAAVPHVNANALVPVMRNGGMVTQQHTNTTATAEQTASAAQAYQSNELLKEMINAQYAQIDEMRKKQDKIQAYVSLQHFYDQQSLLNKGKSLSGINQKQKRA